MAEIAIFPGTTKQRWVPYDGDTEVLIRLVDKARLDEISRVARREAELTGADRDVVVNRNFGREACRGWRKIEDHDHPGLMVGGKPLEFNQDNLDLLMRHSLEFSAFVNRNGMDARGFLGAAEADQGALKNV